MTIRAVTLAGRRAAKSLQLDAVDVARPGTGEGTFDAATGVTTPPTPTVVYAGAARLRMPTLQEQRITAGEHDWTAEDAVLSVPMDAPAVQVGDLVTFTGSSLDPDLPGTAFVVMGQLQGSQVTARRLIVRRETS